MILCLTQVPGLDDIVLRGVDVVFVLNLLYAHAHTVLCEHDILLPHALRRRLAHLVDTEVDLVSHPSYNAEEAQGEHEGEEGPWAFVRETYAVKGILRILLSAPSLHEQGGFRHGCRWGGMGWALVRCGVWRCPFSGLSEVLKL